jgi:hypothetical protein
VVHAVERNSDHMRSVLETVQKLNGCATALHGSGYVAGCGAVRFMRTWWSCQVELPQHAVAWLAAAQYARTNARRHGNRRL